MFFNKNKNFCDINPLCYEISTYKGIFIRIVQDMFSNQKFAKYRHNKKPSNLVSEYSSVMIKKGKGIDPKTQENKAVNIRLASNKINGIVIHPGEVFSFWKAVGTVNKRKGYKEGRVIRQKS